MGLFLYNRNLDVVPFIIEYRLGRVRSIRRGIWLVVALVAACVVCLQGLTVYRLC